MVPQTIPRTTNEAWPEREKKRQRKKEEKAEQADGSSAGRKEEAMWLKSNRMLGKHGTGKMVVMTKINDHGSRTQKSPMP